MHALELPPVSAWTGRVAAWAPFPPAAAAQQQQAGGLPPLKTSSTGVWLKSDAGGVLAVQWPAAAPLLTCTLRASPQPLVRAPLVPGAFAFRLLCPQHGAPPHGDADAGMAAAGSGHLLFLSLALPPEAGAGAGSGGNAGRRPAQQQQQQGGSYTLAVHFDTAQAGRECGALLQAIQQGSLEVVHQRPPPQAPQAPQQAPQPAPAPAPTASTAEACTGGPQQALTAQAAGNDSGGLPAAAAVGAAAAGGDPQLFGYADEASLEAAIQASPLAGWGLSCAWLAGHACQPTALPARACSAAWQSSARLRMPSRPNRYTSSFGTLAACAPPRRRLSRTQASSGWWARGRQRWSAQSGCWGRAPDAAAERAGRACARATATALLSHFITTQNGLARNEGCSRIGASHLRLMSRQREGPGWRGWRGRGSRQGSGWCARKVM